MYCDEDGIGALHLLGSFEAFWQCIFCFVYALKRDTPKAIV